MLYNLWKNYINNEILRNEYYTYCKIADKIIRCEKFLYDKNFNNTNKLWKLMN